MRRLSFTALLAIAALGLTQTLPQDMRPWQFALMLLAPWQAVFGAAKTNTDETEFRTSVEQFQGAGKTLDFGVDSKLGIQGSAVFSNGVTLTAQALGARRNGEEFDAGFEWAYMQYTGIDGLDLKGGRVVLPSFLVSDSRLVGYATPWLRVSPLVYAMMPLSHVDGEQVTLRHAFGPAVVSGQFTYGNASGVTANQSKLDLGGLGVYYEPSSAEGESRNIHGLNLALEWGDWTFRVSQVSDNTTLALKTGTPAPLVAFGYPDPTSSPLSFKDTFQEVGLQYDNGTVVVMAWENYVDPEIQKRFHEATGVTMKGIDRKSVV